MINYPTCNPRFFLPFLTRVIFVLRHKSSCQLNSPRRLISLASLVLSQMSLTLTAMMCMFCYRFWNRRGIVATDWSKRIWLMRSWYSRSWCTMCMLCYRFWNRRGNVATNVTHTQQRRVKCSHSTPNLTHAHNSRVKCSYSTTNLTAQLALAERIYLFWKNTRQRATILLQVIIEPWSEECACVVGLVVVGYGHDECKLEKKRRCKRREHKLDTMGGKK